MVSDVLQMVEALDNPRYGLRDYCISLSIAFPFVLAHSIAARASRLHVLPASHRKEVKYPVTSQSRVVQRLFDANKHMPDTEAANRNQSAVSQGAVDLMNLGISRSS